MNTLSQKLLVNLCVFFTGILLMPDISNAQLKQFQRIYFGGKVGITYSPLTDYNDYLATRMINNQVNFNISDPGFFDPVNNFYTYSLDMIYRDGRDYGIRVFLDYYSYSQSIKHKENDVNYRFSHYLESYDLGVQLLYFITENYDGPVIIAGFGGAFMLPLIKEMDKGRTLTRSGQFDAIAGAAMVSIITLYPVQPNWYFSADVSFRYNQSPGFSGEYNFDYTNQPDRVQPDELRTRIDLSGYMVRFGLLYYINH